MPIMPNGNFRDITDIRGNAKALRNMLSYAARTGNILHPSAVEWKRQLAELEAVIAGFERENAA